jgi:hypothetical protein
MTRKEIGMQLVIDAQDNLIGALKDEIGTLCRKNLKIKMHMQVLVSHPIGMAAKKISKNYTKEKITREQQIAAQN